MNYDEFYVVVYYDGDQEVVEEFDSYHDAKEFYDNVEINEDYFKVLQKVFEWENGVEDVEILEED